MVISIAQNRVQGWFITDNECFPVLIAFNGWTNIIGEDEFFYSIAKSLVLQNHTLHLVHFLYCKPWRTFVYCAGDNCRDSLNSASFPSKSTQRHTLYNYALRPKCYVTLLSNEGGALSMAILSPLLNGLSWKYLLWTYCR